MFNNIKISYLNHKSRINLLSKVENLNYLYKSVKNLFKLLIIFNLLISILLIFDTLILGIFSLFNIILLIPIYYNFIKTLVYSIIWANEYLEININTITDLDA